MKSLNHIQLIGYLGKDPQFIKFKTGKEMARLRMATDTYVHEAGERKKYTEWHTIKIWGPQVERIRNYLIKGSHVLVDGRLGYSSYTDKDGQTRYFTEIRANYLVDLDR